MSDIVVTVPKDFRYELAPGERGLIAWLAEGDAPGEPETGNHWYFRIMGWPDISPGERVYVVCEGRLVGYAPLVGITRIRQMSELVRRGGAVACTIPEKIKGFRGFRYRWWDREAEVPLDLSWEIARAKASRVAEKPTGLLAILTHPAVKSVTLVAPGRQRGD